MPTTKNQKPKKEEPKKEEPKKENASQQIKIESTQTTNIQTNKEPSTFNYNNTSEIKVPTDLIDQVIGQEGAVEIIKKAVET